MMSEVGTARSFSMMTRLMKRLNSHEINTKRVSKGGLGDCHPDKSQEEFFLLRTITNSTWQRTLEVSWEGWHPNKFSPGGCT